jgi:hypothetical protein
MRFRCHLIADGRFWRRGEEVPADLVPANLLRYALKEEDHPTPAEVTALQRAELDDPNGPRPENPA